MISGGHSVHSASPDTPTEDGAFSDTNHTVFSSEALRRLEASLDALKYQHSALLQTIAPLTPIVPYSHLDQQGQSVRASPLLSTAKEEEEVSRIDLEDDLTLDAFFSEREK